MQVSSPSFALYWRVVVCLPGILAVLLTGCGTNIKVPMADRSSDAAPRPEYIVRAGDTLYTIAWVTRSDPNNLADWNLLNEPYLVKPGQRIALHDTGRRRPRSDRPAAKPVTNKKAVGKKNKKKTRATTNAALKRERDALGPWSWPSNGEVVSHYSPGLGQQGIDIRAELGSPVRSVAAGRVVYAGTGLRGYGRLIIIKHGKHHLSAYGNNQQLLVSEQKMVSAGQQIGTMGQADNGQTQLHFELRHHGKPIDPIQVLPSRN